jgi:four helix bundle protein
LEIVNVKWQSYGRKSKSAFRAFSSVCRHIVNITTLLRKTATGREIARQLLRSGASAGANYEESRGAQSRADFIHKLQIVLKELRESLFWSRLIDKSHILQERNLDAIINETKQLSNIIAKSVVTAKGKK